MSDVGGEQVQTEPVQVCEGRWRTRGGDIRNVTLTPECDNRHDRFPWRDTAYDQTWAEDGRYFVDREESPLDLDEYLGPIEQQPEPKPEPEPEKLPEGCRNDGGWSSGGGAEPEPWPEPQPEPQLEPQHLQAIIAAQAETIARLQSEVHELNMEIGGLQRKLSERDARIRDLETMHAAATQAVVDAGKENDKLRAQADDFRRAIQSRDALAAANREQADASVSSLQADCNDLAGKVVSLCEQLQQEKAVTTGLSEQLETVKARIFDLETINQAMEKAVNDAGNANNKLRTQAEEFRFEISYLQNLLGEERAKQADKLAQLEVLQPIAAACHTAQTMVRDMLGHMRCLLALQHTTDRGNFCTLLESILEVFDEAECDEDEDEDTTCTTNTSEAGQG